MLYDKHDSFDRAGKINNIPKELLNCGYNYASFNVESLFTNAPLRKPVDIIFKRIHDDKLIQTNPSCPNPKRREKIKLNIYFHTSF